MKIDFTEFIFKIFTIVFFLIIIWLIIALMYHLSTPPIEYDFCSGNLIHGSGSIMYCDGKPFVCNLDKCDYLVGVDTSRINTECYSTGKSTVCDDIIG